MPLTSSLFIKCCALVFKGTARSFHLFTQVKRSQDDGTSWKLSAQYYLRRSSKNETRLKARSQTDSFDVLEGVVHHAGLGFAFVLAEI